MKKNSYLVYLINPYNYDKPPKLFLKTNGEQIKEVDFSFLLNNDFEVITYQLEDLFSFMHGIRYEKENSFIDICQVARLIYGRPFKDQKGKEPWTIWSLLNQEFGSTSEVKYLWNYMYRGEDNKKRKETVRCLGQFSLMLEKLWISLKKKLAQAGEEKRYFEIEKNINEIFLRQQLIGIKIGQSILLERLDKLDKKIGDAGRILRKKWLINDPHDKNFLIRALRKAELSKLTQYIDDSSFDSLLSMLSGKNDLPKYLKIYYDNERDKQIILRMGGIGRDRIFPIYKTIGTVTGRIIVESPSLQHLRKINRDILIPEKGKIFLYPDYSQFEPGIMADDSKDQNFIADFNSGDLYKSLSRSLFGSEKNRDSAKIIFLSFCYGMSIETMVSFAAKSSGREVSDTKKIITDFFGRYNRLNEWKNDLGNNLTVYGRIGTRLGNYRYRDCKSGIITNKEKRWIVSQRIQGTASLILKKVIIEIYENCREVDILLPMHDALLLQVPEENSNEVKDRIEEIFISNFMKECPSIRPRVSFDNFIEPEEN
jgi:DNA polymerase I-like protein with 3'-5' exonuclease and polymerase domains